MNSKSLTTATKIPIIIEEIFSHVFKKVPIVGDIYSILGESLSKLQEEKKGVFINEIDKRLSFVESRLAPAELEAVVQNQIFIGKTINILRSLFTDGEGKIKAPYYAVLFLRCFVNPEDERIEVYRTLLDNMTNVHLRILVSIKCMMPKELSAIAVNDILKKLNLKNQDYAISVINDLTKIGFFRIGGIAYSFIKEDNLLTCTSLVDDFYKFLTLD